MDNLKNPHWSGGQARVTYEVARRLSNHHHEVVVYCSKYPNYQDYALGGIKYVHIGMGSGNAKLNNLAYIVTLPFIVARIKADIIIENFTAPFVVCFSPIFTKIPVVGLTSFFSPRAMKEKYKIPFNILTDWGIKLYKHVIVLTEIQAKEVEKVQPEANVHVISNGVDEEYFTYPTGEKDYLLFMGRLDIEHKGLDLLLEAFNGVRNEISENLYIMGSSINEANQKRFESLIKKFNLVGRVKLLGRLTGEAKNKILAQAKLFVAPSRFESQSLSSLEAMAMGKAEICFNTKGFEWIDPRVCIKVKPFSTVEFGQQIVSLLKNMELRSNLGAKARIFAKNYSWENSAKKYESVLSKIIMEKK